jgi:hypothetical protein
MIDKFPTVTLCISVKDVNSTFPPTSKTLTNAGHSVVTTLRGGSKSGATEKSNGG